MNFTRFSYAAHAQFGRSAKFADKIPRPGHGIEVWLKRPVGELLRVALREFREPHSNYGSPVEGIILNPVKPSCLQQEFRRIDKVELSMNFKAVHRAVDIQMAGIRPRV